MPKSCLHVHPTHPSTNLATVFSPRHGCSDREKFLALSGTSLVVIFFLTSVGSTLFYALGLSMLLIGAHAAFRVPGARARGAAAQQAGSRGAGALLRGMEAG